MTGETWDEGIATEAHLVAVALALDADRLSGWSEAEVALARAAGHLTAPSRLVERARREIRDGDDPLGRAFCDIRDRVRRRAQGAVYTPQTLIRPMLDWAAEHLSAPARVVDPGSGSGRFVVGAGRRFPRSRLVAVETDPLAALLCRAHLVTADLADRASLLVEDYRTAPLGDAGGATLFIGNPPYVRHHQIDPAWKAWLARAARDAGLRASGLSGLHVHFFLATAARARTGDLGVLLTSSEWLDTRYGRLVRELLLGPLGGEAVHIVEPSAAPFSDATTTAAITCFRPGRPRGAMRLRRVDSLAALPAMDDGRDVSAGELRAAERWSPLSRVAPAPPPDYVQLGDVCRVHRGAVTGANATWIVAPGEVTLPSQLLFPTVTRAREIIDAGAALVSSSHLRLVIDLPSELDVLDADVRHLVERFLRKARRAGANTGYIARARRAWWSVGLRAPAPILATYMARRPPAFTLNAAAARHINIAHGLYPRVDLPPRALTALVASLRRAATVDGGRMYAGGLAKFEPRDMERLAIPDPLAAAAAT
ncbi:MAG: class I SAM-dependent methyltransferase [Thermoleophilia bacterium]